MTQPLNPVRRNSFRRIDAVQYLDVTLGRVLNVTVQDRNGADHIVTEFQNGTLILSKEEMETYIRTLELLLPGATLPPSADDNDDWWSDDDDDYQLRNVQ